VKGLSGLVERLIGGEENGGAGDNVQSAGDRVFEATEGTFDFEIGFAAAGSAFGKMKGEASFTAGIGAGVGAEAGRRRIGVADGGLEVNARNRDGGVGARGPDFRDIGAAGADDVEACEAELEEIESDGGGRERAVRDGSGDTGDADFVEEARAGGVFERVAESPIEREFGAPRSAGEF